MNYQIIDKCRSCGGDLLDIISLGEQVSVGFTDKPEDGNKIPLDLVLCPKCYLLQLKHTTNTALLYNENYGYRSGVNQTMKDELKDIVDKAVKFVEADVAVDIGCNDGTLLSNYPVEVTRVGFDPSLGTNLISGNRLASYCQENLSRGGAKYKMYRDFFAADIFKRSFEKAKIVTAIAMFYDLDDPNKFLKDVHSILDDDGVFIIQQNYLAGMLQNVAFDNIVHEHLEYYSLTSLESLLNRNGFVVVDVEEREVNGGSFRVYAKKKGVSGPRVQEMRDKEKRLELD